jgi:hypothetical protein
MKGSLILERIRNPQLRRKWHNCLDELHSALAQLNKVRHSPDDKTSEPGYLEAVLRFAEARDDERNFFWDTFVEERVDNKHAQV